MRDPAGGAPLSRAAWPAGSGRWPGRSSRTTTATPRACGPEADTGAELLRRLRALPGFGDTKARIFLALLGKQRGVQPPGWEEAAGGYAETGSHRSVADVVDAASLAEVRAYKQLQKQAAETR